MTESRVRRTAILFVMVLVTAGAVHSQTPTGGIRGVVSDNPGVAVPAVALVATNIDTNLRYPAVTNPDGIYRIAYLLPGRYLISASKSGYKAVTYSGVEVRVGRDVVLDIRLEPGDPSETIQLDAGHSGRIQRDTSQVSFSFTAREIQDLPINSPAAGLDRIALLLPGLTEGFAPMNANGASLSVNGGRDRSNNFSIDGADNNDPSVGGPSYFMVNPAAVAEFQVITGNSTAEHGRNLGGEVNIVSRTGSNRLNGSLSWAHQDRKNWDSLTNLERRSGQYNPAPNLINVFGYGIGGPIIRDRLFFYSSGLFLRNPGDVDLRSTSLAPTPEGIQALKSSFPDSPAVQYYADYSAFALPAGNPTVRQDVAQSTINVGGVTIPVAAPRRVFSRSNNRNDYTARLDLEATQKDKFWMRTFFQDAPNPDALLDVRGWNGDSPVRTLQVGGAWVRNLSPLSVNELRFGYARHSEYYGGGDGTAKGRIPDSGHLESAMTFMSFPGFLAANGASLLAVGPNQGLPQGRFVESFQIVDNFDRVAGKHQLRIGLDIRRLPSRGTFLANANGAFSFRDGKRLAENNPNSLLLALGPATLQYGETDQFYYLQDDWRVRENLTLNLGLRYENTGQPANLLHDATVAREGDPARALWRQNLPLEDRVVARLRTDGNNWAPHVGFVYSPNGESGGIVGALLPRDKTVISGGFGIAYDPTFYNLISNVSSSPPVVFLATTALPVPDANPTGQKVRDAALSVGAIAFNTFDPSLQARTTMSGDFHAPYSLQWTLGYQRELLREHVFELRYVGTRGVGLFRTVNGNPFVGNLINGFSRNVRIESASGPLQSIKFPGFPQLLPSGIAPLGCTDNPATPDNEASCNGRLFPFGLVLERANRAESTYHGLQVRLATRFATQFSSAVSYTWSHAIDDSSEVFRSAVGNSIAVAQNPLETAGAERGNSGLDARHTLAAYWIWELPWKQGQKGLFGRLVGGWQASGILRVQTAHPFNPTHRQTGRNPYEDSAFMTSFFGSQSHFRPFAGNASQPLERVAITDVDACVFYGMCGSSAGVPILRSSPTGFWLLNGLNASPAAFVAVSPEDVRFIVNGPGAALKFGTPFGNVGRNSFIGDRVENVDLSIARRFRVTDRFSIRYQLDLFDASQPPELRNSQQHQPGQCGDDFLQLTGK